MAAGAIIGAGIAAGSKVYEGIQARKAAKRQARALSEQARLERESAEFEAIQASRRFDKLLGTQKARISGSGIKLEGSPLLILEETLRDKKETIENIRRFGSARSEALRNEAFNATRQGRSAMTSSIVGAFGSGLSAFGKMKSTQ